MSAPGQLNFSMILRMDAASAKSGIADVTAAMKTLRSETAAAAADTERQAGGLQSMADAATKAAAVQERLVAAERRVQDARARAMIAPLADPGQSLKPLQALFRTTDTAAAQLQATISGLGASIGGQAQEMIESAAAARVYQQSLDDIRASFNPLFAATRQYEAQLARIAKAEELGAISSREAAAARLDASRIIAPASLPGGQGNANRSFFAANIGAQGFDVGVTSAMGMNPLMIGLQQGSQLAQVAQQMGGGIKAAKEMGAGLLSIFNATSLVTIGLTTLAAVGIQALTKLYGETKSWDDRLGELDNTLSRMKTNLDRVSNIRLGETFGNLAPAARGLAQGLIELDRASELKSLKSIVDDFAPELTKESWGQWATRNLAAGIAVGSGSYGGAAYLSDTKPNNSANYNALGAAIGYDEFLKRTAAISALAKSGDVEAVTNSLADLTAAMSGGRAATDMSEQLRTLLGELAEAGIKTAEIEALLNGSAQEKAITRQTDQMVLGYRQAQEMSAAVAAFGKDSVAVEQLRAKHVEELVDLRLEEMHVQKDSAEWTRVHTALTAQLAQQERDVADARRRQIDQMVLGYRQETDMAAAVAVFGKDSVAVERLRGAQARELLHLRLEEMGILKGTAEWTRVDAALTAKLAEAAKAVVEAQRQAAADRVNALAAVQREIGLIGASNAERLKANALAEVEIEIQKEKLGWLEAILRRQFAITKAEEEARLARSKALHDIDVTTQMDGFDARIAAERDPMVRIAIEAEKEYARQIAAGADAQVAAAAAAQVRARALAELRQEQADFLKTQEEAILQQRLELALVGQSAEVRSRVLAMVQAERDIQRLGYTGEDAERVRRNALIQSELAVAIEAQADAWKRVQSAGEDAIDAVLDRLKAGDIKGALRGLLSEIEEGFFDLAIRNPLKNAIFGTNLGTWSDVGGWDGIWGRLSGQSRVDERALTAFGATPVQTMSVTAASVTLSGPGVMSFLGGVGGVGQTAGALGGSADVQSQIWSFFAAKGLQPFQIAAIMGNVSAESGFDPLARGDGGNALGLFQWNDRAPAMLNAIGGQGNLGNVQAQLEYAWRELLTSENASLQRLLASGNLYDATHAFAGFERPGGYNINDPTAANGWAQRLAAAEAAMRTFEGQVQATGQGVGQLGTGAAALGNNLQGFGMQLQGLIQGIGAQYGPLGSFAGGLLSGLIGLIPGFDRGGWTGSGAVSDVAGVVHAEEYVFDAPSVRRIGVANLEAIRRGSMAGYRDGGYVSGGRPVAVAHSTAADGAAGRSGSDRRVTFEINVAGTGGAEIRQAVEVAMATAFDQYGREVLPVEVRTIINDRWK